MHGPDISHDDDDDDDDCGSGSAASTLIKTLRQSLLKRSAIADNSRFTRNARNRQGKEKGVGGTKGVATSTLNFAESQLAFVNARLLNFSGRCAPLSLRFIAIISSSSRVDERAPACAGSR